MGVAEKTKPDCVIIVDALASRSLSRLCSTVQIADTGIVPGSGVGNSRAAINRETLGVPVVAVGLPTVVDAATLASDLVEKAGVTGVSQETLSPFGNSLIVTPREIDAKVSSMAKVLGYAISMSVHNGMSTKDISAFLS